MRLHLTQGPPCRAWERAMTTDTIPGEVPEDIIEGLMAVRDTAMVNMLDRKGIVEVAVELGLDGTASWMRDKRNSEAYVAWLTGKQE